MGLSQWQRQSQSQPQPQPASAAACLSLSLSLPQPQPQPASASASVCLQPRPQPQPASASACLSVCLSLPQPQPQQNVAREWSSGNTKNTKWPTVGSGHSKCGPGMEFWELEDHEVAYSWLRAFKMWPGNGVLAARRAILRGCPRRFGTS